MGFYSPATLVKDAQRHGVEVLPIDVARSEWRCALQSTRAGAPPAVRLGLRCVGGLREQSGRADRGRERGARVFANLARSRAPRRARAATSSTRSRSSARSRASIPRRARGAARSGRSRRSSATRLRSSRGHARRRPRRSPLPEMRPRLEETLADYRVSGVTTGAARDGAPARARSRARGVLSAAELARRARTAGFVRTAGHAIVRQRPGSAKGFCFVTLEDETGTSNAVLTPRRVPALPRRAARRGPGRGRGPAPERRRRGPRARAQPAQPRSGGRRLPRAPRLP